MVLIAKGFSSPFLAREIFRNSTTTPCFCLKISHSDLSRRRGLCAMYSRYQLADAMCIPPFGLAIRITTWSPGVREEKKTPHATYESHFFDSLVPALVMTVIHSGSWLIGRLLSPYIWKTPRKCMVYCAIL